MYECRDHTGKLETSLGVTLLQQVFQYCAKHKDIKNGKITSPILQWTRHNHCSVKVQKPGRQHKSRIFCFTNNHMSYGQELFHTSTVILKMHFTKGHTMTWGGLGLES